MAIILAQSYLAGPMPHVRRAGRRPIHEHCEPSGEHTPPQVTSVINSYMYREYVTRSRAILLVAQAASARWCRARLVSETVFSVSRRDVCSSYCLRRVTTARFPHCDCWKAKPVEIGQGTACERDDTKFFRNASNFSRLFCHEHVCAWKLACYKQWNGVSELWKTLLGCFHKLKDFLAFDGGP